MSLYRYVSQAELDDIAVRGFSAGKNSMEGKWFAETADDTAAWGEAMNETGGKVIQVRVPNTFVESLMRQPNLDGIGPARYVDSSQLSELNSFFN